MTPAVRNVFDALVSRGYEPTPNGDGFMAPCPRHQDKSALLHVHEVGGRVVLHCRRCRTSDVLANLGMSERDLLPGPIERSNGATVNRRAALAAPLVRRPDLASTSKRTESWEDPRPFPCEAPPPPFPLDALPTVLRAWSEAHSGAKQVASDLPAVLSIGVLSLALQRRVVVSPTDGHREPVNLYLVVALKPGEGKSPVFRAALAPVTGYEARTREEEAPTLLRIAEEHRLADARIEGLRKRFANHSGGAILNVKDEHAAAIRAKEELPPCREPFRLTADDATPEALERLLAAQCERIGVVSPEGGPFAMMDGRYSKNGSPNFDLYLKAHSGEPFLSDRITRSGGKLERPAITLLVTVQPMVVREIIENPAFYQRGLLGRCWIVCPQSMVGFRDVRASAEANTRAEDAEYGRMIETLLSWQPRGAPAGEVTLALDDAAREAWIRWKQAIEPRLRSEGDLSGIADWANKIGGGVLRLAGLLHFAERVAGLDAAAGEPIDLETMMRALRLGDYFLSHAVRTFDGVALDERLDRARAALGWLRRRAAPTPLVSPRHVQRGSGRQFRTAETAREALETLCEYGYARRVEDRDLYEINPKVLRKRPTSPTRDASTTEICPTRTTLPTRPTRLSDMSDTSGDSPNKEGAA